jgi:hypothetical protein
MKRRVANYLQGMTTDVKDNIKIHPVAPDGRSPLKSGGLAWGCQTMYLEKIHAGIQ